MRLMLFFDGRNAKRAWPVVREYIRPNVKPKKSNSPSGTLQICVLSSFTVSFSLPMISIWRLEGDSGLTPHDRSDAEELMVCRLPAGGRRIRTGGPPVRRCAFPN